MGLRGELHAHTLSHTQRNDALAGGLTGVLRSVSGEDADLSSFVSLLERQMCEGGKNGGPDEELCKRVEASGLSTEEYISHCNAHLLPAGTTRHATKTIYTDLNRSVVVVVVVQRYYTHSHTLTLLPSAAACTRPQVRRITINE